MFRVVQKAPDFKSRQVAARPIFDQVRAMAEWRAKTRQDYSKQVASIFTPLQWKLLSYAHLTPAEEAQAEDLQSKAPTVVDSPEAVTNPSPIPTDTGGGTPPSILIGVGGAVLIGAALGFKALKRRKA
jgi:hypothetical protein